MLRILLRMSENNHVLGVPAGSRTPEGLNLLFVDVFHQWLCENSLTFEDFTHTLFQGICSFYTKKDVAPVADGNSVFCSPNASFSSSNEVLNTNVPPTHGEIMIAGFAQAFIDANWEDIMKSSELQVWMTGIGTQTAYLRPLTVAGCNLVDKKARINKVVTLVLSALWNNWCNFEDKGGVKARTSTSETVPALHTSVADFLFKTLQRKLRSMRGTSSRKGRRGKNNKGDEDDDSDGEGDDEDEEDENKSVFTPQNSIDRTPKAKNSNKKQKIAEETRKQEEQQQIWDEEQEAELRYQKESTERRLAKEENEKRKREAAALAKVPIETPAMKEKRIAEALEYQRQKENSVIVKAPGQAKRRVTKNVAQELEKLHGDGIYPREKRESPRKVARTEKTGTKRVQNTVK